MPQLVLLKDKPIKPLGDDFLSLRIVQRARCPTVQTDTVHTKQINRTIPLCKSTDDKLKRKFEFMVSDRYPKSEV